MAWKNPKRRSLADALVVTHEAVKELDELNELIDGSRIEYYLSHIHATSRGEKAWPPVLMFKALSLLVHGTNFQIQVWRALLRINS